MAQEIQKIPTRKALVRRFWSTAGGYWRGDARRIAWLLTVGLIVLVFVQLAFQYRLNVWNRDIFNAIERKDGGGILNQALIFLPLATLTVFFAVVAVYGRMTLQRKWREWVTNTIVDRWLAHGHYYQLNLVTGDHQIPEGRITDDARVATDAPVDFAVGILSSIATAATFIGVLWVVGGSIEVGAPGAGITIPGYLVIAAVVYSMFASAAIVVIARRFISIAEATNQAEADFRFALSRVRENGESVALLGGEEEERAGLRRGLGTIVARWRELMGQHMRSTVVSNGNALLAPVIPLVLCAPKYIAGTMTLGEVTQVAAAFVHVQSAFNWLVDNYPRLADWMASVRRVGSLLVSIDHLEAVGKPGETEAIKRVESDGELLRLRNLSVTLDDGTAVIKEANVEIAAGDKVLLVGESGTGKSTLVRAIAGLWPWGEGEIEIPRKAKLFLMPQRPYIPLGTLRRVVTYPLAANEVPDSTIRELMELVGIGYLVDRLDVEAPWDHVLSGGEKQRVNFVRLLLHRPQIVVMDEATSALDPASQARLMQCVIERFPDMALLSVAHRPELEAFHERKLVFEHRPGGSRVIGEDIGIRAWIPFAGLLSHLERMRGARA
jgi:putative ATP-binding cassette transporter